MPPRAEARGGVVLHARPELFTVESGNAIEAVAGRAARGNGVSFAICSPMKNQSAHATAQPALQRDPDEWKTGDEPMTDAQRSHLETLCLETGEEFDDTLSKADASKRIDELRHLSPRLSSE